MAALKTYDLFNSHAWKYNDDYTRLVALLNSAPLFQWRNYSVPVDKRFINMSDSQLVSELKGQIRPVNAVLVLCGMYVSYSKWIQAEIDIANAFNKPIIGIVPWGQQLVPAAVRASAKTIVAWNTASIVAAIRTCAI